MTMKHRTDTFEIERRLDDVFPEELPQDYTLLQVNWDNFLSENGDLRREVFIRIKALSDGLDSYTWRIPHLEGKNPPFGIRVRREGEFIPFESKIDEKVGVTEVIVNLKPLEKNNETYFTIEYFHNSYPRKIRKGPFSTEWEYHWAYKFFGGTEYFEKRIYLPKTAKVDLQRVKTSLPQGESFEYGDWIVCVWKVQNPGPGAKSGQVPYKIPFSALPATVSLVAGLLLAIPLGLLSQFSWLQGSQFSWFHALGILGIFLVVSIGVFISHWLIERLT
jgi:hypothetical protein